MEALAANPPGAGCRQTVMDDLVSDNTSSSAPSAAESSFTQGLKAEDVGASSIFTGQEELFAFARCVSRLVQMG
jgi:protein AFG1